VAFDTRAATSFPGTVRQVELQAAMAIAIVEAEKAAAAGDVPVGAVVLDRNGELLAQRHNEREARADPTAHAELLALQDAAAALGEWRLEGCTVVVTLEPCPMCAGGLLAARVARVVFGAFDPKAGACGTLYNLCVDPRFNHQVDVVAGVRAEECAAQLSSFFATRRSR
jgi:tRNA(adenine34) deaminase